MQVASMRPSFRNGFYAGLLLAIALGIYLFQLWRAERQIELHSVHFLEAVEEKEWTELEGFLAADYQDQWGQDRALVLSRLRELLRYTRALRVQPLETLTRSTAEEGEWRARITVDGEANEVMLLIQQRINSLEEPFAFQWRRQSWKPWDWRLVRVSNPALELPENAF
ncbi:MAG: hypothetical protein ABR589_05810 [Chthoniobacterales bacterium]